MADETLRVATGARAQVGFANHLAAVEREFGVDVSVELARSVSQAELALLSFTATATDADVPADTLAFSLQGSPPAGASITAGGAFTWTPTEAQGPGVYPVTIRVNDDGTGLLWDEETINVTVNEANIAPVLDPVGDKSVDELVLLSFTAIGMDSDTPLNALTFTLQGSPPAGASITGGGDFTWTPTEAQGPGVYPVTIRVTDDGTGLLWDEETINVTVNEVNVAPVLAAIGDQSVDELVLLSFTATATDADLPANTLTFSLQGVPPAGAAINPVTGGFTWTPSEAQGLGVYAVTIRVTDDGTGLLWDEETINVTVNEVNVAPVLAAIGDKSINELALLSFIASATDADAPPNGLTFTLQGSPPAGTSLNPITGLFDWTPNEAQGPGVYAVTIRVTDDGTGLLWDEETIDVTVNEVNVAPVLAAIGDQSVDELVLLSFTATATDADLPANTLTFSLQGVPPAGAAINPVTGGFTWTPSEAQGPGVYAVTIRVTDDGTGLLWDEETINVTVNEVNVAPVLAAIGDKSINELALLSFIASATDADAPPNGLTFTLQGSPPAGTSLNPITGLFDWTPNEAQGPGVYAVTIRVTDDGTGLLWDEETIDVTVNEVNVAPVLAAIGDQSVDELVLLSFTATATDADLPANTLTFSLQGVPPAGAAINPVTGGFTWTPSEAQGPGVYAVTIRVTDDGTGLLWDEETINVTVNEVNVAPVLAAVGDKSINEQVLLSFTATATDADLPANTLTFSLQGSPPAGAAINPVTGGFTWTPTEAQGPGVYPITIRVTDNGTGLLWDEETINITVNEVNVAPVLAAIGDKAVAEQVLLSFATGATDADLPANTLTFSLEGAPPAGAAINPSTGAFTWTPTEAQGPGVYPITIRITDDGAGPLWDEETISVTVSEANVAPVLAAIGNKSVNELVLLTFVAGATDADLPANTLTFTLEGSPPAGASINPVTGLFDWTPTEAQGPGVYAITIRVTDNGTPNLFDEETINVTVNEVNVAPALAAIGDQSTDEQTLLSFTATATDADLPANTLTFSLEGSPPAGAAINPVTGLFTWTPSEAQGPGVYAITIRVTDNGSGLLWDEETFNVTVADVNVTPVLAAIGDKSVDELALLSFTATATDADLPANTLTFSLQGVPPAGTAINPVSGLFTWTPTEAQGPGLYPVTIRVTDDGTGSLWDEETITVTVNELNVSPVLAAIGDKSVDELVLLSFAAGATDADLPANTLTFSLEGSPPAGAAINPATGLFAWTPTEAQGAGVYAVRIRVTDDGSGLLWDEEIINVTVNEVNVAPVLAAIGDQSVDELIVLSFVAGATDADLPANTLTFSLEGSPPAGAAIVPATGAFTWTPTEAQGPGVYPVTIRVTDNGTGLLWDEETFNVTVNEVNLAPSLTSPGDQLNDEGDSVLIPLVATDPDDPPNGLTFTAVALPPGLFVDPFTGVISGVVGFTASTGSPYAVIVTVTDSGTPPLDDVVAFTWTVNDTAAPLTITKASDAGGSVLPGETITYTVTVNNLDSITHTGVVFTDPVPSGTTWVSTDLTVPIEDWVLDMFEVFSFANDDGSAAWAGPWIEIGEADGPGAGDVQFLVDGGSQRLRLRDNTRGVERPVDLSSAAYAELSFDVRRDGLNGAGDWIDVDVWDDGGSAWVNLVRISGPATGYVSATYDITPYMSANTRIHLLTSSDAGMEDIDVGWFDNIEVRYVENVGPTAVGVPPLGPFNLPPGTGLTMVMKVTVDDPPTVGSVVNTASVSSVEDPTVRAAVASDTVTNRPPVLAAIGDKSVAELLLLSFTAIASDPDLDGLTFSLQGSPPAGAAINPSTGAFTWTPTEAQGPGVYPITIRVTDDGTGSLFDEETISVTVIEVNVAPVLAAIGDKSVDELVLLSFAATATDVDLPANTLTFSLQGSPAAGAAINPVTGAFTWTATEAQGPGVYPITIRVTDDGTGSLFDEETISVTVIEVNVAPVLAAIGDKSVDELVLLSFTATATDVDLPANTLTFSLQGSPPAGAAINPVTGAFTWTPAETQGPGVYPITIRVTDDGSPNLFNEETINVTVNEVNVAPVLDPIGDRSTSELVLLSFTAAATDADVPANTLAFSLQGVPPPGASLTVGGLFTWTPTEAQGPGVYPVTIRVTDNGTGSLWDEETFNVTVNEANVAPALAAIGDQSVDELVLLNFTATATDADLPANTLTFSLEGAPPAGTAINPVTGLFTWTPTEAQGPGVYPITVRVTDDGAGTLWDEETFNVTVNEVNVAPVLAAIGDQSIDEGVLLSFTATATDADLPANTLSFSLQGVPPAGVAINPVTGAFTWTPTEVQGPGVYPVTVRVTDDGAGSLWDEETFNVTVNEANIAPVLGAIGDRSVGELTLLSFTATATDADLPANTLSFSLQGVPPAGVSINPVTGAFTWTPTEVQGPGVYPVTVRVTDDGAGSLWDEETFNVTVNEVNVAPVLAAIGDQSVDELTLLSSTATATDADVPANTLVFSLQGVPPAGAAINPVTGAFTWTPTEVQGPGVYAVTVRVTDDGAGTLWDEETFNVTVGEVNVAPVLGAIGDQSVDEQTLLSFSATATDVDVPANTLSFSLEGAPPAGIAINPVTGALTWTPTEAQGPGVYPVTVRVTDDGAGTLWDEETFNVTVNEVNVAPVLGAIGDRSVNELTLLSFTATATDADLPANTLSFSLQGVPPAGVAINPVTGAFTWTPTEVQGPGVYPVTVRVTDDGAGLLWHEETFNVTVGEVNVAPVLAAIGDQAVDELTLLSFIATATDVDLPANTLTFSITGGPAGVSINPVTGAFTWTPTEAQGPGGYAVTVRVTDDGTGALWDAETFTVTVNEVNVAPVLAAIGDQSIDELTLLSFTATATDADLPANTLTFSLQGVPPIGVAINPSTGAFTWTPTEVQGSGVYPVAVRVTDDGTGLLWDEETFNVTVEEVNVAPVLAAIGDQSVDELTLLSFTATATDADLPANALTFSLQGLPPAGVAINPTTGDLTWTPTEVQGPGVYPVTVRVTDDGTGLLWDEETFNVTVDEVNVAPVLAAIGDQSVDELTLLSFTATATDADLPANALTFSLQGLPPAGVAINPTTGDLTWTPTEVQGPGVYPVTVRVTDDGTGLLWDEETFNVTVNEVNVAPVLDPIGDQVVDEETLLRFTAAATDVDLPANGLTFTLESSPPVGAVIDPVTGDFTWTPTEVQGPGTYPITVRITDDGSGFLFDEETIDITVNEVNVAPVLVNPGDQANDENQPVSLLMVATDVDAPANALTFTATDLPDGLSIDPVTGEISGVVSYEAAGTHAVTVTVTDDGASNLSATVGFDWVVTDVNRPPVATPDSYTVDVGETRAIGAPGVLDNDTDPDGDTLTAVLLTGPTRGTLAFNTNGSFTYTHTSIDKTGDSFTYTAFDGALSSETVTVVIRISGNQVPFAVDDAITIDEDTSGTIEVLGNDTDPDGDVLTAEIVVGPEEGDLVDIGSGIWIYTPSPDWNGTDTFTYRLSDGEAGVDDATVTITVLPVNDPPTAVDIEADTDAGEPAVIELLAGADDIDGDDLFVGFGSSEHGKLTRGDGGSVTYVSKAGYNGEDSFTYTVIDGKGGSVTHLVRINVHGVTLEAIGLVSLVNYDEAPSINTTNELDELSVPGLDLLFGSAFQSFNLLQLPLLALALGFGLSLMLGLSRGLLFGMGPVFLPPITPARAAVVFISAGERLPARDEPGDQHEIIYEFDPAQRDLRSTGRRAQVGDTLWIEVETSEGDGWVDNFNLTSQVSPNEFANDSAAVDLANKLATIVEAHGSLGLVTGDRGLHVAHFGPPEHVSADEVQDLLKDESVWAWWSNSGSIPEIDGTFQEVIGLSYHSTHGRYEPRANAESYYDIPVEFVNFQSVTYSDPDMPGKDAWRIFYDASGQETVIVALWKENIPNPAALSGSGKRRLVATG